MREQLVQESMALEQNVGKLYDLFAGFFPGEVEFWMDLSLEEENHAVMIRDAAGFFDEDAAFLNKLICESLPELQKANADIRELIEKYKQTPPTFEEALKAALHLETSAGELHYAKFMALTPTCGAMELFQKLSRDDHSHAGRIRKKMNEKGFLQAA